VDHRGEAKTREISRYCWDGKPTDYQIDSQRRAARSIGARPVRREAREWVWRLDGICAPCATWRDMKCGISIATIGYRTEISNPLVTEPQPSPMAENGSDSVRTTTGRQTGDAERAAGISSPEESRPSSW